MAIEQLPPPVDAPARERALAVDRSFLIQAPAGSGKTELLIRRYLRLLAGVARPEEIVAITFTRKAAGEMRGRILEALELACDEQAPAVPHRRELWMLGRAALANAEKRTWGLTANPSRLQVHTIDALCAWLNRRLPMSSGIGPPPELSEQPESLYRAAVRLALANVEPGGVSSDAVGIVMEHVDNDFARLEALLVSLLGKRDQWLRLVQGGLEHRRSELEGAVQTLIRESLERLRAAVPAQRSDALLELLRGAADTLAASGARSAIVACRGLTELPGSDPAALPAWLGIAEFLLTRGGELRRRASAAIGLLAPSAARGAERERRAADKCAFEALIAELRGAPEFQRRLAGVRGLPQSGYSASQWRVLGALTEVLSLTAASLTVVSAERGQADFQAVAAAALRALGEPDDPTDLALALDYRVQHILVDEFQDTSYTQYELLKRLTAGWAPGDGRTLFLVGDPMQSIYSFREAQVGLFLRVHGQRRLGTVPVEFLQLRTNFRARTPVMDWINRSFPRVLAADTDIGLGAVPYTGAVAAHLGEPGRGVSVHPLYHPAGVAEAQAVGELLRSLRRRRPRESIAILVRSRNHLVDIVAHLKALGIAFRAVDIDPLETRAVVQDLFALTRALVHGADRIAWLAVLRAPWCGLPLADLEALVASAPQLPLPERLARGGFGDLGEDAGERLRRLAGVLDGAAAERQRRPLARWVEGVWLALGGPACVRDEAALDDARAFFDLLDAHDVGGELPDLGGFTQALGELYAAADPEAGQDLQIMTIHKAKGLEFDNVIVPGLGRGTRRDEAQLLVWLEEASPEGTGRLLLAPLGARDEDDHIYRFVRDRQSRRRALEEARLLYVAATRARHELHLLGHVRVKPQASGETSLEPAAGSLLACLWPAVDDVYVDHLSPGDSPPPSPAPGAPPTRDYRLASGWRLPPPDPAPPWRLPGLGSPPAAEQPEAIEFQWARPTIRHVGTVVHLLLRRVAEEGPAAWPPGRIRAEDAQIRAALAAHGVPIADIDAAAAAVQAAAERTLGDARGRWILDPGHCEAHSEFPITGIHEGRLVNVVLDRTFVAEGVRWIVDYKTSVHEGADLEAFYDREVERYRAQLERYASLMHDLDGRPVRVGLYFPLLGGWREWQAAVPLRDAGV